MDFKKKTSTYNLANKKDIKKAKADKMHKLMDDIIGVKEFIDLGDSGRQATAILKSESGYSAILKVSTTDAAILSTPDLLAFESTLIKFCFGLDFPVKLIRTNRKQDFRKYMRFIDEVSKNSSDNSYLMKYKEALFKEFKKMEKLKSNNVKTNYIVVFSNDPSDSVALKEVQDRANYVLRCLQDMNFRTTVVANLDLFEYLYFNIHKDIDIDIEKFFATDSFRIITDKFGGSFAPREITDKLIEISVNEELKRKSQEELELREKLSEKEYKKHIKILEKNKRLAEKKDEEELLKLNLVSTAFTDLLKPDVFEEKEDYIRLGTQSYVRLLAVNLFPATMNIALLNSLNNLENMETHIYLEKQNESKASKLLRSQVSKIKSNIYMKERKTDSPAHAQRKLAANYEGLIEAIETNEDKLFHAQILIKLWSDNLVDLENKTKTIKETFANSIMDLKVLFYDQKNAFINTLPIAEMKFHESKRNITTGGAACLIPTGNSNLRHDQGIFIGKSVINNSPIILDFFLCQKKYIRESEFYSNPNIYICGKPGSGKSTFIKVKIARSMLLGDINVGLDPHNEYVDICNKLHGHYVYLQNGKKSGINPLELRVSHDDNGNKTIALNVKIGEITDLINNFVATYRDGVGLKGIELTEVSESIRDVYENFGITEDPESLYIYENGKKKRKRLPILSDLRAEMEKRKDSIKEVCEMMKLITGNGTMNIFDCQTDENIEKLLESRLVMFSLLHLDKTTKTYAMTTMLNWLWSVFSDYQLKNIQKNVLVDEAWNLAKHIPSLLLLENFVRSGRKYLIGLSIATQSIQEFKRTP